jgi:hypothetical protein
MKGKRWFWALATLFYTAVLLWLGIGVGTRMNVHQAATEIDSVQASLAFNRLLQDRKMASFLSRGCIAAAVKETDIAIDQDTKLLASLFKGKLSPWAIKYVEDRDPELLKTLANFQSKYGSSWPDPECDQPRQ